VQRVKTADTMTSRRPGENSPPPEMYTPQREREFDAAESELAEALAVPPARQRARAPSPTDMRVFRSALRIDNGMAHRA
jgi:hypothetical protein